MGAGLAVVPVPEGTLDVRARHIAVFLLLLFQASVHGPEFALALLFLGVVIDWFLVENPMFVVSEKIEISHLYTFESHKCNHFSVHLPFASI